MFETRVVKTFNDFFARNFIKAFAYRFPKASRYGKQYCDVLVDSLDPRYYLAIECKSTHSKTLYFSKFNTRKDGTHQLDTLRDFEERTQRSCYIAIEQIKLTESRVYFLPLGHVYRAWRREGQAGLDSVDIRENDCKLWRYITI